MQHARFTAIPAVDMRRNESKGEYHTLSLFGVEPRVAAPAAKTARRVEIYFDGGCLGNPGQKYGSFQVKLDGKEILKRSRVTFGHGTNNEAEFNALKLALDEAVGRLQAESIDLKTLSLLVETDSTIVKNRLVVKNVIFKKYPSSQRMFALANECLGVMNQFGAFNVVWKGRANNVERFGH
jgi:ribonuclease HI